MKNTPFDTIFARTFLLVGITAMISLALAAYLILSHPPLRNAPVHLHDLTQMLLNPDAPHDYPPHELSISVTTNLAVDTDQFKLSHSAALQKKLATYLNTTSENVVVMLPNATQRPPQNFVGEGFVAAYQNKPGHWILVQSHVDGFPTQFHLQVATLFGVGVLIMLPLTLLFSRALVQPIQKFAQRAHDVGSPENLSTNSSNRSENTQSLDAISGPLEIRMAGKAFNNMQERIQRMLTERLQTIAAIAHDLRSPLMRLSFRIPKLDEPIASKIQADIDEMSHIIDSSLEVLRERVQMNPALLDLRLLVESIVDEKTDLGEHVSLTNGASLHALGDPVALKRAILNIIDNALYYGNEAKLTLTQRGNCARLCIQDKGPGIPDNKLESVFEPFVRIEESRNRNTGGVGFGLTVARGIISDHGGTIALRNGTSGGLLVTIELPLLQ